MANEFLFRLGFSGELLHLAFDVMVSVILYALLRPVDRNIALLAAFMRFACDIVLAVASLSHFAALQLFADAEYLKTIGALIAVAGVCYLINSFSHFLYPAFAATLFPGLFVPIFVAELSLALWLTVKGVNVAKWEEKAGAPRRHN